ncbi:MAG TPA: alpha/beta hydrolase [Caulobacteraceae bacterium]
MACGCSTTGLLNTVEAKGGVAVSRNIAYAQGARHGLDVYAPRRRISGRPVVVFFYGGSWDSGARGDYAWVGYALAQQGYVVVLPDYRLFPQARWPAFLQDCALAVRWARDHGGEYGGDVSRLILIGHSAGAYNAVELAVDARWLTAAGVDPARDVRGVVGLSGPYDFLPVRTDELKSIFGPPAGRLATQPINHVDGRAAPMLLLTGDRDRTVEPGNSDRMAAKVRAAGGQARVIHYPKLDHVRTLGAFAGPLRWLAPSLRDVTAFVNQRAGFAPSDWTGRGRTLAEFPARSRAFRQIGPI